MGVKAVFRHLLNHLALDTSQAQFDGQGETHWPRAHNQDIGGEGVGGWCFHGFTGEKIV
jgi:hypothetical protein